MSSRPSLAQRLNLMTRYLKRSRITRALDRMIEWATEPIARVTDPEKRQHARVFAGVILVIMGLIALAIIGRIVTYSQAFVDDQGAIIAGAITLPIYLVLYLFTRRGYSRTVAHFLALYATVAITIIALISDVNVGWSYFYFFAAVVIGVTHFISTGAGIVYVVVHQIILAVVLRVHMYPNTYVWFAEPVIFNLFSSGMVLISSLYRDRIERDRRRKLTQSEIRYRVISESIADFVFECRLINKDELVYDWVTLAAAAATGYSWEDLQKNPGILETLIHPDDRARAHDDMLRVIHTGLVGTGQYRMVRRDGEIRWVMIKRRPFFDDSGGKVIGVYGIGQDITEHRTAEAERLRVALERERLAFVSQFVQAISHEFRSNLANIETHRYLIQRMLQENSSDTIADRSAEAARKADSMRMHIQRMTDQLRNLGTITNLSALTRESTSIAALIEGVAQEISIKAETKAIHLIVQGDHSLPKVTIHREEMRRAIRHLLDNALRFTPHEGTITLRTRREGDYLLIDVIDSGAGIAPDQQERIFDLFYKIDPARSMSDGGMGLGLSIVRLVMEAHSGIISLESTLGIGSTFTLWLPLEPAESGLPLPIIATR